MSFIQRNFWANFCHKRFYICGFFCNEVRLPSKLCFSSFTNAHRTQLLGFKFKRLENRSFSVLEIIKDTQRNFYVFCKQFSRNWFAYVPIYGSMKYKLDGYFWFKTLDEINVNELMTLLNMPDTFYSRFNIIELHVWMLLFNLPNEGRMDTLVRHGVIEGMWEDAEKRGKMVDPLNLKFRKDFKRLSNKFQVALLLYDNGYLKDDVELSNVLWYNFFNRDNIDPRILEGLVEYIRCQMDNLSKLNFKDVAVQEQNPGIWISPQPFVKHLKS